MSLPDYDGGTWGEDTQPAIVNEIEQLENQEVETETATPVVENIDLSSNQDVYFHADRYSKIWFEHLTTKRDVEDTPIYGIFTTSPDGELATREFCGVVTDQYKFMANETVVDAILNSLGELGGGEIEQRHYISDNFVSFREDIAIRRRGINIENAGMVIPTVTVENSYNGSKAASYAFGIEIVDGDIRQCITFREKIASMRQVHIITSRTSMTANIGEYMTAFDNNIADLVSGSFETILTPEDVMKSLKLVEKLGKKRYKSIVTNLAETSQNNNQEIDLENPPAISAWKMFQAIAKFSALEENLNAKKLLDNIAERTLIIPARMIQALT